LLKATGVLFCRLTSRVLSLPLSGHLLHVLSEAKPPEGRQPNGYKQARRQSEYRSRTNPKTEALSSHGGSVHPSPEDVPFPANLAFPDRFFSLPEFRRSPRRP
jgi:hypothetical protein